MSESPHSIMKDGMRAGYSNRQESSPYARNTTQRGLWDIGWIVGETLRRRHDREFSLELEAVATKLEKGLK